MPLVKAKGLVLKQTDFGDYDRMLTVLTDQMGKVSVSARGARSMRRRIYAGARVFSFSEFVLYVGKSAFALSECTPIEVFFGLARSLEALEAAAYICSFADYIAQEHEQNVPLLRLTLNCLHILSNAAAPPELVKSVFRLRGLCMAGFEPVLDSCAVCGASEGLTAFSPEDGGVVCGACAKGKNELDRAVLEAMRYLAGAPLERLFSFELGENYIIPLKKATEGFAQYHTEFKG